MENSTTDVGNTTTELSFLWDENHIFTGTISILLSMVSIYLLISLIIYFVRTKKQKKIFLKSSTPERRYGLLSLFICLLVTSFSLIRNVMLSSAAVFFWLETSSTNKITSNSSSENLKSDVQLICDISVGAGNLFFTLGIGFVYLFLWVRQRIFYIHPAFQSLNNKCVSFVSISLIIVWFAYDIFTSTTYFIFVRFKFNERINSCVLSTHLSIEWFIGIIISWSITSIIMQLTLLALFIYPLLRQESWRRKNNVSDSALLHRVKKAVMLTLVSLATDVLALVLTLIFDSAVTVVFYNINLFINNLAIIGCFDNWKAIVLPGKIKSDKK